jgi:Tfp pilus assembly protein PilO
MDIKAIKSKIESLSQREKIIAAVMLTAIVVVVPYMLLYSPSSASVKNKKQAIQDVKKEIEAANAALASQASSPKEPAAEKIVLPEAEDLSGMLAAISREATIANVDFVSIAPEGFEHKNKFIELKVKIELRVKFRELHDFIKNVEMRHKLFLVQELKFETNASLYPSGIALLKAVTYLRKKE